MYVCARARTDVDADVVFLPHHRRRRRRRRRLRVKYDLIRPRPQKEMCDTKEGALPPCLSLQ